jgi:hypothetical protein
MPDYSNMWKHSSFDSHDSFVCSSLVSVQTAVDWKSQIFRTSSIAHAEHVSREADSDIFWLHFTLKGGILYQRRVLIFSKYYSLLPNIPHTPKQVTIIEVLNICPSHWNLITVYYMHHAFVTALRPPTLHLVTPAPADVGLNLYDKG